MDEVRDDQPIDIHQKTNDSIFTGEQSLQSIANASPTSVDQIGSTRKVIALLFAWTFAGTVAISLIAAVIQMFFNITEGSILIEVLKTVIPPTVAVVGTVTGFYFGSNNK